MLLACNTARMQERSLCSMQFNQRMDTRPCSTNTTSAKSSSTHGLVGYDVALTRRRSSVRIRVGILCTFLARRWALHCDSSPMAQSVARQAVNLQVAGSNPAGGDFAASHGGAEWRSGQRGGPITHRSWDRNPPLLLWIFLVLLENNAVSSSS